MAALGGGGATTPATQGPLPVARPRILDLYRALWDRAAGIAAAYRLALATEVGLIAAWLVVRTIFGAEGLPYLAWTAAVAAVGLVSPASGLVVLVAIAPFDEPAAVSDILGARHLLVWVLGVSVALRVAADRRSLPWSPPLLLAGGVALGTALGVVYGFRHFDAVFATVSARNWVAGVGGGIVVLFVAAWCARRGQLRPLYVAVATATLGALVSLADWFAPALLRDSVLAWLLSPKRFPTRLSGIIGSPNAVEALLIGPTALLTCLALLGRQWRWRVAAALALLPLLAALYYTFSRAALVGIWLALVFAAWRIRRAFGAGLLAVGIVVAVLLMPGYLELRGESINQQSARPDRYYVASDVARFRAWGSAFRMWLDRPLTGRGFRSYKLLGDRYGDRRLNSPHNEWLRLFAEEGVVVGVVGLGFGLTTLVWLARVKGWLGTGLLAAFAGWAIAATFNNPFLFIQVSLVAFTLAGTGLALAVRAPPEPAPDGSAQAREAKPGGPLGRGDDDPPGEDGGKAEQ